MSDVIVRLEHVEEHCPATHKRLDVGDILLLVKVGREQGFELADELAFPPDPLYERLRFCHLSCELWVLPTQSYNKLSYFILPCCNGTVCHDRGIACHRVWGAMLSCAGWDGGMLSCRPLSRGWRAEDVGGIGIDDAVEGGACDAACRGYGIAHGIDADGAFVGLGQQHRGVDGACRGGVEACAQ